MTSIETGSRGGWRWLWTWGRWGLVLVAIGAGYYQLRLSPVPVSGEPPQQQTIVAEVMGTGTLEARVSTTISPKIAGRIDRVLVDQGDAVTEGQLLAQLDDEDLRQQVEIASANREAAEAALERLTADKSRSVAVFAQAEAQHERIVSLHQKGVITDEDLETSIESLAVATADTTRAEAAIREGEKELLAAEKTLAYHRARLADTTLKAPFAGLIVERQREAGDIAVPGSAVLTLISTEVVWISAWVDETAMANLAVDQPARIVFRSQPEQPYPGSVVRLGRQADRETREFVVDVEVAQLPTNWAVGQRAEVFIETQRRDDCLAIPLTAVSRRDDQDGVWIAKRGLAHWQPLGLGLRGRTMVEVTDGLSADDLVLAAETAGSPLTEGRRVRLR